MRLLAGWVKVGIGVSLAASMMVAASAQPVDFCDSGDYTTVDLVSCTSRNLHYEDSKLNMSYKSLMKLLENKEKNQLKQAQLAWIKFKESSCKFSARHFQGSSMYAVEFNSCITNYTYDRRLELDNEVKYILNQ